jgi:hypothetical protein
MASAVEAIGSVTWHHLFVVASNAAGERTCLRAGPESLPLQHHVGRMTEHGKATEDYDPPKSEPYGVITFCSAPYEPGGVDYDPAAADVDVATGAAAEKLWQQLQAAAQALQEENIPYDPTGKGANWAIMAALGRCGCEPALPPKRWIPGLRLPTWGSAPEGFSNRLLGQAVLR